MKTIFENIQLTITTDNRLHTCKPIFGSITINADSVPTLEEGAFRDLPSNFRIYVPKTHTKRYRDAWPEYADHIAGNEINTNDIIEVNVYAANTLGSALGLTVHHDSKQGTDIHHNI